MRFQRNLTVLKGLNYAVIPLVDSVFLLLIFFMLGSSLVFQSGITVRVPEITQQIDGVADKLVITMTKEKLLFFNDQKIKDSDWRADLDDRLKKVALKNPTRRPVIILKADRDVSYNHIVQIMAITLKHRLNVFLVTKTVE